MPSASELDSCVSDPNFAVICSFLQHYADALNIMNPTFKELQEMIENKNEVAEQLVNIILRLLRKSDFPTDRARWERRLSKFCLTYSIDDAAKIRESGFRNLKTAEKLRVIKELFEYQFEHNTEFKKIVNEMTPEKQRFKPLLEDDGGHHLFWTMTDSNDDAVVYEENLKKKSWNVLARDRDELSQIIRKNAPASPPRRTSARRSSSAMSSVMSSERKAKDLLKEFRVSIERLKGIA